MAPPWSVHRIRPVIMAAIGVVLIATLSAYYARRQARPAEAPPPKPVAEDVGQQTRAFSLSKTVGEHTLYTIHAEQVTNYEDTGKVQLHGVSVTIFGKDGSRHDTITSPECMYDPATSSIWVPGDVEMRFDVPKSAASAAAGSTPNKAPVAVFTSKLTFDQSSGVASTDAPVRFQFAEGEGTSQGASYDPQQQELLLKKEVRLKLTTPASAKSSGDEPTMVSADTAQYYREQGRVVLNNAVEVVRATRRIRSSHAELDLDEGFHVRQARLTGDVIASDDTPSDALRAAAQQATVDFGDAGRMRSIDLAKSVSWSIRSKTQDAIRDGAAEHVTLYFRELGAQDAETRLDRVVADGSVRMKFQSAPAAVAGRNAASSVETQTVSGENAEMIMAASGKTLDHARMRGAPRLDMEPAREPGRPGADRRTVTANEFLITMNERGELSKFHAEGGVHVTSDPTAAAPNATAAKPPQQHRESSSDFLEAFFDGGSRGSLNRIRQWGHFEYRDPERQARAAEANSVVSEQTVVLQGSPSVWSPDGKLSASEITLETESGAMRAEGGVSSTFVQKPSASGAQQEPVHAVSDHMRYDPKDKTSHFEGHARLWQGESFLLEATTLHWSAAESELTASGKVYSVFREQSGPPKGTASGKPPAASPTASITVTSNSFRYQQQNQLAHYEGNVRMKRDADTMTASELDVVFNGAGSKEAADLSLSAGQIQRAEARRDVTIVEGTRTATGDRAEYLPGNKQVHLYGSLAKVTDRSRGTVEGAELTYFLGDDRIQVQGSPGSPTETRWQVHP